MYRKSRQQILSLITVILLATVFTMSAGAQGSGPTDDEVNAIAKQLYCPVCENIPLDACGTVACEQWRGIIRDKLEDGWSEDQIKIYFVDQYGDRVLAEPPRRGFNWLIYVVPLIVFIIGGFILYRGFQTWLSAEPIRTARKGTESASKRQKESNQYINLVEEELRKRAEGEE
jgi:cytochrome c-type biogenesis protein CcmH